ncbi:LuxR C-terminal-related transcriptional regulator [Lentzea sp. NPDC051213]|uniref:helix-turn-helix transcriptional regulator n=1 Tax=Lentzea sp. NPDC051213 TaxID=3364126 RepID=UPI00379613B1
MRTAAAQAAHQDMIGDRCGVDTGHLWTSVLTLVYAGNLVDAQSYCLTLTRRQEWQRSDAGRQMLQLLRSRISFLAGEPPSARDSIGLMLSGGLHGSLVGLAMAWGVEELLQYGAAREANLLLLQHDCAATVDEDLPGRAFLYAARAAVQSTSGQAQRAVRDYLACGRELSASGVRNPAVLPWRSRAAVSAFAVQHRDLAQALAREELTAARMWGAPRAVGEALRALGLVLGGGLGDNELAEAIDLFEVAGARNEIIRTAYELGRRRCDEEDFGAARERFLLAAQHARATGNDHWAQRVDFALQRTGLPRKESLLTKQEAKVAALARAGYGNREIAEQLFLALRTVEFHLSAVYRKRGITGRRDLHSITADFE